MDHKSYDETVFRQCRNTVSTYNANMIFLKAIGITIQECQSLLWQCGEAAETLPYVYEAAKASFNTSET